MEPTLERAVAKARAEVNSALYDLEDIMDAVQESQSKTVALKRTLRSVRSAILDATDHLARSRE